MIELKEYQKHLDNFSNVYDMTNVKYIAICKDENNSINLFIDKKYDNSFDHITKDEIIAETDFTKNNNQKQIEHNLEKDGKKIFCTIYPVFTGIKITAYIIIESAEKTNEVSTKILSLFIPPLIQLLEFEKSIDPNNNKYKVMLMKMREMQAQLFPSFSEIQDDYDIKSAYLPADLMSGNFIDAFLIKNDIYQIAICDTGGYDAFSSFAGATIRTLIRSHSGPRVEPSSLISLIIDKLNKLLKKTLNHVNIVIYQINPANGITKISSYGSLNTLYFISSKKTITNLNNTDIGKTLSKRFYGKDIRIQLSEEDSLLYFSNGVVNLKNPHNTEIFGETNIIQEYSNSKGKSTTEITQNIIEKIYSFSDYSPVSEDIILLSAKKHRTS